MLELIDHRYPNSKLFHDIARVTNNLSKKPFRWLLTQMSAEDHARILVLLAREGFTDPIYASEYKTMTYTCNIKRSIGKTYNIKIELL